VFRYVGGFVVGIRFARAGLVLALVALALPAGLGSAHAATVPVADWELDDASDSFVMADSSGQGNDGIIAADHVRDGLTLGVSLIGGGTGYNWGDVKPNVDIKPDRVVKAPQAALNPGSRDWEISFRYRTTRPFGNIMQKGQSQAKGGQIKFQLPAGQISCMFKGGTGVRRSIKTVNRYDDGAWHVVVCDRLASGVTLNVYDGSGSTLLETRHINGSSGSISNTVPFTIGGKPNCNQVDITCDFFEGDIDWIRIFDLS
jgi:laminin G domain protein